MHWQSGAKWNKRSEPICFEPYRPKKTTMGPRKKFWSLSSSNGLDGKYIRLVLFSFLGSFLSFFFSFPSSPLSLCCVFVGIDSLLFLSFSLFPLGTRVCM